MNANLSVSIPIEFVANGTGGGASDPTFPIAATGDFITMGIFALLIFASLGIFLLKFAKRRATCENVVVSARHAAPIKKRSRTGFLVAFMVLVAAVLLVATFQFASANEDKSSPVVVNPEKVQLIIDEQTGQISPASFSLMDVSSNDIYIDTTQLSLTPEAKSITSPADWNLIMSSTNPKETIYSGSPDDKVYTVSADLLKPEKPLTVDIAFEKFSAEFAKRLIGKTVFNFTINYINQVVEPPEAITGLIYDGTVQTGVLTHDGYTITGNTALDAGNYEAVATLDEGAFWSDGTTEPKTIPWSISKAVVTDLKINGRFSEVEAAKNKYYTFPDYEKGEVAYTQEHTMGQGSSADVFDESKIQPGPKEIKSITEKLPNTYYLNLANSYTWIYDDANVEVKNWSFEDGYLKITPHEINIPTAKDGLIYDKTEQIGVEEGEGYTITGNSAINAGPYTAIAKIEDWCIWSTGDKLDKEIPWSIAKAVVADLKINGRFIEVEAAKNKFYTFPDYEKGEVAYTQEHTMGQGSSADVFDESKIHPGPKEIKSITEKLPNTYYLNLANSYTWIYDDANVEVKNWSFEDGYLKITPHEINIPTAKDGLIYDKTEQIGVEEGEGYTITGNSAINAGPYKAIAKIDDWCIWSTGDKLDKEIAWSIAKAVVADLKINGRFSEVEAAKNKYYTFPDYEKGEVAYTQEHTMGQGSSADVFDESKIKPGPKEIKSITEKLPNTYYLNLANSYTWIYDDANVDVKNWSFEDGYLKIYPHEISVPVAKDGLIYDKTEQIGVEEGEGYTISGNKGMEAKIYYANASLKEWCSWPNDDREDKTIMWTIDKAIIDKIEVIGAIRTESYKTGIEYELPYPGDPAYIAYGTMHESHPYVFDAKRITPLPDEIEVIKTGEVGHHNQGLDNKYTWDYTDANVEVAQGAWDITDGFLQINSEDVITMNVTADKTSVKLGEKITYKASITNLSGLQITGAQLMLDNEVAIDSFDIPKDTTIEKYIEYTVQAKDFAYPNLNKTITFVTSDKSYYNAKKLSTPLSYTEVSIPENPTCNYDGQEHGIATSDAYYIYGDVNATDVNKYVSVLILNPGYIWNDGTKDMKIIYWEIKKIDLLLYFNTGSVDHYTTTYGTEWQASSAVIDYNSQGIPVGETPKTILGTDPVANCNYAIGDSVGQYFVTISIPDESQWKSHNYNVKITNSYLQVDKKAIGLLWSDTSLSYNGQIQYASAYTTQAYDKDVPHFSIKAYAEQTHSSEVSPKNAGTYYETATLIDDATGKNYYVSSGSSQTCYIQRINSSLSNFVTSEGQLLPSEISILGGQTITGTFDYTGDGILSAEPKTSDVATYTFEKDDATQESGSATFSIKADNVGNLDLSIQLAQSINYNATSYEIKIHVEDFVTTPKAVLIDSYSSHPITLKFVYDNVQYVVGQNHVLAVYEIKQNTHYDPLGASIYPVWYGATTDVEEINIDESFINFSSFDSFISNEYLTSLDLWFANMPNLKSVVGIENIYDGITSINAMFKDSISNKMEILNLMQLNQSNVTSAISAFENCKFAKIALPKYFLSEDINCNSAFKNCSNMTDFFDVENLTFGEDASYMFYGCSQLKTLDVSNWNVDNAKDMTSMFEGCSVLTINAASDTDWSDKGIQTSNNMFTGCNNLPHALEPSVKKDVSMARTDYLDGEIGYFTYECGVYRFDSTKSQLQLIMRSEASKYGIDIIGDVPTNWNSQDKQSPFNAFAQDTTNVACSEKFVSWTENIESLDYWFSNFTKLQDINVSNWTTSNVTTMKGTFNNCTKLTSDYLKFENWTTSSVKEFESMFEGCELFESLNIGNFNTSSAINMNSMFKGCKKLRNFDLTTFDVSSVKDFSYMFKGCESLKLLDITQFNVKNAGYMTEMFAGCAALTIYSAVDTDWKFVAIGLINSDDMFKDCKYLPHYGFDGVKTDINMARTDGLNNKIGFFSNDSAAVYYYDQNNAELKFMINAEAKAAGITACGYVPTNWEGNDSPFIDYSASTKEVTSTAAFNTWTINLTSTSNWFDGFTETVSIDVSQWRTDNISRIDGMFYYCLLLSNLDVSKWKTDNIISGFDAFQNCRSLDELDVSQWTTEKIQYINNMFNNCSSIKQIDLHNWNFSNVENVDSMLANCSSLVYVNFSSINPVKFITATQLFEFCESLEVIDISNWDISSLTDASEMFNDCQKLRCIYCDEITDWSKNTFKSDYMFHGCECLPHHDTSFTGKTYARADMLDNEIGYFTPKNSTVFHYEENSSELQLITCAEAIDAHFSYGGVVPANWTKDNSPFSQYNSATKISLSDNFVTWMENVTSTQYWFDSFSAIESIDVTNWNVSNVNNFNGMFSNCESLKYIYCDVETSWTKPGVSSSFMFGNCSMLPHYNVDEVDINRAHADMLNNEVGYFIPKETGVYCYDDVTNPQEPSLNFMLTEQAVEAGKNINGVVPTNWNAGWSPFNEYASSTKFITSTDAFGSWMQNVASIHTWFHSFTEVVKIDLNNWNVQNVNKMTGVFWDCSKLIELNISDWNTESVTDMSSIFEGCESLAHVDINSWDVRKVEHMSKMFACCSSLDILNLSSWNTGELQYANQMFEMCSYLKYVNLSNFSVNKIIYMDKMFSDCNSLLEIFVKPDTNWKKEAEKIKFSNDMFSNCSNLPHYSETDDRTINMAHVDGLDEQIGHFSSNKELAVYHFDDKTSQLQFMTVEEAEDANITPDGYVPKNWNYVGISPFLDYRNIAKSVTSTEAFGFWMKNVTSTSSWFMAFNNLLSIDVSNWDVSKVSNMAKMFEGCSNLQNIYCLADTNWSNKDVTDSSNMFYSCFKLPHFAEAKDVTVKMARADGLDGEIGFFTPANVYYYDADNAELEFMTYEEALSAVITPSGFVPTNWNEDYSPFAEYASTIKTISSTNSFGKRMVHVQSLKHWFDSFTELVSIDVSSWDINHVKNTDYTFYNCNNLSYIYCNFDTDWSNKSVTQSVDMFKFSSNLPHYSETQDRTITMAHADGLYNKIGYFTPYDVDWGIYYYNEANAELQFMLNSEAINNNIEPDGVVPINWTKDDSPFVKYRETTKVVTSTSNFALWMKSVTSTYAWFKNFTKLEIADIFSWDVSNVINMNWMFFYCFSLKTLNISKWELNNVTTMSGMFLNCRQLLSIDVSKWNVSKARDLKSMFTGCESLKYIYSNNDTDWSKVTGIDSGNMFEGCTSLPHYGEEGTTTDIAMARADGLDGKIGFFTPPSAGVYHYNQQDAQLQFMTLQEAREAGIIQDGLVPTNWTRTISPFIEYAETTESVTSTNAFSYWMKNVISTSYWFNDFISVETIDVSQWDVSNVKNMSWMFGNCVSLPTVDVSRWKVGNVADMASMFYKCKLLSSLNVSQWEVGKVSCMMYMFSQCESLNYIDVSQWVVNNVDNMFAMFCNCYALSSLDLSKWDVGNVSDMNIMFMHCGRLQYIYCNADTDWSKKEIGESYDMFEGCTSLPHYDETPDWTAGMARADRLGNELGFFVPKQTGVYCYDDETNPDKPTLNFMLTEQAVEAGKNINGVVPTNWSSMEVSPFAEYAATTKNITSTEDFDFWMSHVTSTFAWFYNFSVVETIDVKDWAVGNVTRMELMFCHCNQLSSLDVSQWDVSKVNGTNGMFYGCQQLSSLDVSQWHIDTVTNMSGMFMDCFQLPSLDVSQWHVSNNTVTDIMFANCSSLKYIYCNNDTDWSNQFSGSSIQMFEGCTSLPHYGETPDRTVAMARADRLNNALGYFIPKQTGVYCYDDTTNPEEPSLNFMLTEQAVEAGKNINGVVPTNWEDDDTPFSKFNEFALKTKSIESTEAFGKWMKNVTSTKGWFNGFCVVKTIDVKDWEVDNVGQMDYMFRSCWALHSLDISKWKVNNVSSMIGIFGDCSALISLDIKNWNIRTNLVVDYMFINCSSLKYIYCNNDTDWSDNFIGSSTDMFEGCTSLLHYSETTDRTVAMARADRLNNTLGYFIPKQTGVYCYDDETNPDKPTLNFMLTEQAVEAGKNINGVVPTNWNDDIYESPFKEYAALTKSVISTEAFCVWMNNVNSTITWFLDFEALNTVDVSLWNVSNVIYMTDMFANCRELSSIDVSQWDVRNCVSMEAMFIGCSNLKYIYCEADTDWSDIGISKTQNTFYACESLPHFNETEDVTVNMARADRLGNELGFFVPKQTGVYCYDDETNPDKPTLNFMLTEQAVEAGKNINGVVPINWTKGVSPYNVYSQTTKSVTSTESFGNWMVNVTSTLRWFESFSNVETIDVKDWKVGNVTNMFSMFFRCEQLSSLDVSKWNVGNVNDMAWMFNECKQLTSLDVSQWEVGNVENLGFMFYYCNQLSSLDVSQWDVGNVENLGFMFYNCNQLSSLDVSQWDVGNVTFMVGMFELCSGIKYIYCNNDTDWSNQFSGSSVDMFDGCTSLPHYSETTDRTVAMARADCLGGKIGFFTPPSAGVYYYNEQDAQLQFMTLQEARDAGITQYGLVPTNWNSDGSPFDKYAATTKSVTSTEAFGNWMINVTSTKYWFSSFSILEIVDASFWDVSNVKNMSSIFYECSQLSSLDVSKWKVGNVTDMNNMFFACRSLLSLDVSQWDVSNVTNMNSMFAWCDFHFMDVSKWNVNNVDNMGCMFVECGSLYSLDVSQWDVNKLSDSSEMFSACRELQFIYCKKDTDWSDKGKIESSNMFVSCVKLPHYSEASDVDITMARADGLDGEIGFFTADSGVYYYDEDKTQLQLMTVSEAVDKGIENYKVVPVDNQISISPFVNCEGATSVISSDAFDKWMKNVSSLNAWFKGFESLESIDVSKWDISNVNNMSSMFDGCSALSQLDISNWNITRLYIVKNMFSGCINLSKIYSRFNTDWSAKSVGWQSNDMFKDCTNLPGYKPDKTDIKMARSNGLDGKPGYFTGDHGVYYYDEFSRSLQFMTHAEAIDAGITPTGNVPTDYTGDISPFADYADKTVNVISTDNFAAWMSYVKSLKNWFAGFSELQHAEITNWNTSYVIDMSGTFSGCSAVYNLNFENWKTDNVEYMNSMFKSCESLDFIDCTHWNVSNVRDFSYTFSGCKKFSSIDITNFNVKKVAYMTSMFENCEKLTIVSDVDTNWNTQVKVLVDSSDMFSGCSNLPHYSPDSPKDITWAKPDDGQQGYFTIAYGVYCYDQSKAQLQFMLNTEAADAGLTPEGNVPLDWDSTRSPFNNFAASTKTATSTDAFGVWMKNVNSVMSWFYNFSLLEYVDVSNWDTSNFIKLQFMFYYCSNLSYLDVSNWNVGNFKQLEDTFYGCRNLKIYSKWDTNWSNHVPSGCYSYDMFRGCTSLPGYDDSKLEIDMAFANDNDGNKGYFTPINYGVYHYNDEKQELQFMLDTEAAAHHIEPVSPVPTDWRENHSPFEEYAASTLSVSSTEAFGKWFNNVTSTAAWFLDFNFVKNIDVSKWDVSNVDNMSSMFAGCNNLVKLDVSNWNVSSVTEMTSLFSNCQTLEALDFSKWDFSEVTNMTFMFKECSTLKTLDVSNWDLSSVEDMTDLFRNCSNLVIYSNSDTDWTSYISIQHSEDMFDGCLKLPHFDETEFRNIKMARADGYKGEIGFFTPPSAGVYHYNQQNAQLQLMTLQEARDAGVNPDGIVPLNGTDWISPFKEYELTTKSVSSTEAFGKWMKNVTSTNNWFFNFIKLESVDLISCDFSNIKNMIWMFASCASLTTIDISQWNVDNVTNMEHMFSGCEKLQYIYCNEDTDWSKIERSDSYMMFYGCTSLPHFGDTEDRTVAMARADGLDNKIGFFTPPSGGVYYYNKQNAQLQLMTLQEARDAGINPDGIVPTNWTKVASPFGEYAATTKSVSSTKDFGEWMKNVTSTKCWFYYFLNVKTIDVSQWDVSNVTTMLWMFGDCLDLKNLDVSKWDVSSVADVSNMFVSCKELTNIDVSNWDVSNVTNMGHMFYKCEKLQYIYCKENTDWYDTHVSSDNMFSECISLPHYSETEDRTVAMARADGLRGKIGFFTIEYGVYCYDEDTSTLQFMMKSEVPEGVTAKGSVPTAYFDHDVTPFTGCNDAVSVTSSALFSKWMINVTSIQFWFCHYGNLRNIDISQWDTSNVLSMKNLFANTSFETINLSNWDTSKVKSFYGMFYSNNTVSNIILKWNTSSAEDMSAMFFGCSCLKTLDVSNWNVEKVYNTERMFMDCYDLKIFSNVDTNWLNTATSIVSSSRMFTCCYSLPHYSDAAANDITCAKADNGTSGYFIPKSGRAYIDSTNTLNFRMYYEQDVPSTNYIVPINAQSRYDIPWAYNTNISKVNCSNDFSNWFDNNVVSTAFWFTGCSGLNDVSSLTNLHFKNVSNAESMFESCMSLQTIDMSTWDLSKLANSMFMFAGCNSLATIYCNLHLNQSAVLKQSTNMFVNCTTLLAAHPDVDKVDKTYARPYDIGSPGLFTAK